MDKVDLSKYVVSSQKTAATKSIDVKPTSTKIEAPAKPTLPSAPSYSAPQKLQLKSQVIESCRTVITKQILMKIIRLQMLAYRMLARGENLLDFVMKAATSRYQFQIVFPDLFYTKFFDILQILSRNFLSF